MVAHAELALKREALPHDLVFWESDDILWLGGADLERATHLLGLCTDGQERIGLDGESASYYIHSLLEQGLSVGVARGSEVKTITLQGSRDPATVASTMIAVAPVLVYGNRELAQLVRRHTRRHNPTAATVEQFRRELRTGNEVALRDIATLYVFQVGPEAFDWEWNLITVPQEVVEALAVAAHLEGKLLRCQLVEPKGRRGKKTSAAKPKVVVSEPVSYGQLRLAL